MDDDMLTIKAATISKTPTNISTTQSSAPSEILIKINEPHTPNNDKFNIRKEINEFLKEPKPKATPFLNRLNTVTYDATKVRILLD